MTVVTRQGCRVCGGQLSPILDLGRQRISGAFGDGAPERKVPLELVRCAPELTEGACGLVQLAHTVPGEILYSSYWYRSGVNRTMTENLHEIGRQAEQLAGLCPGQLVVDVGCNDGTLLDGYATPDLCRTGFDPSDVAAHAERKGYKVIRDYFSHEAFVRADGHSIPSNVELARVVTSIAMFYDLEDPARFVRDIATVLAPGGVWCLELHYLPAMLESNGFDAIVHEHLCYYSLAVLERLLHAEGLEVISAVRNGINGGSIRVFAGHRGAHPVDSAGLRALRVAEFEAALDTPEPYRRFAGRVRLAGEQLRALCLDLSLHASIHVYGASTKGNAILQYAKLGPDVIECAADRNPDKAATLTATGIPVVSEEESRAMRPDYYLVLPWHFLDEFVERERAFLDRGGKFIVPLPEVRVVGAQELALAA